MCKTKIKAVQYIRVSTDEQVKNGDGLDIQRKELKKYCKVNNIEVVHEPFVDSGISGANDVSKRKGLNDLLTFCKDHEVNQVIVTKMDRLARDVYVQLWIEKELKILNIQIVSVSEDNLNGNDYMTNAMRQMVAVFAELEKNRIYDRLDGGRRNKAESGHKASGNCPYGYRYQYNNTGKKPIVIVDDEAADTVKSVFTMYLQGKSLQDITDHLNDNNITTARGNKWNKQSLKVVLTNRFYTGVVTFGDIETQGEHTPIINKITFGKVQSALQKNRRNKG